MLRGKVLWRALGIRAVTRHDRRDSAALTIAQSVLVHDLFCA